MLAYCVHILARIRPLSLKLFRGPLYFACFIIFFHLQHITTKKQARVRRAPVLFTSIILFAVFTQVSTSFFCITYYILLFLRYFCCCIVFFFNNMDFIYICFLLFILYFSSFPFFHFFRLYSVSWFCLLSLQYLVYLNYFTSYVYCVTSYQCSSN